MSSIVIVDFLLCLKKKKYYNFCELSLSINNQMENYPKLFTLIPVKREDCFNATINQKDDKR